MADLGAFIDFHNQIRGSLFVSGFTIGSFLFSMKSSIIKTLKEDVYDKDEYQDMVCQKIAHGGKDKFYEKLKSFSNLIHLAILSSFISAISQFTFGFFQNSFSAIFCTILAVLSWIILGLAIFKVQENLNSAINFSENEAQKKNKSTIKKHRDSKKFD